jgi:hypothetical protein
MKKIFTLVSVLLVIAFGAGQAIGAVGTMDDVLAPNIFAPFFLVDTDLANPQENTLIAYQEMRGLGVLVSGQVITRFHGFMYDIDSNLVFDWYPDPLTPWDVNQFYMSSVLDLIPPNSGILETLQVTVDGSNYYAGYIVMENLDLPQTNHVGGWIYQVSLAAGKASCSKLPAREWALGAAITNQGTPISATTPGTAYAQREVINFTTNNPPTSVGPLGQIEGPGAPIDIAGITAAQAGAWFSDLEGFSANALAVANERSFGIVLNAPANPIQRYNFFPRYFILDHTGTTLFFIWTNVDTNTLINHVDIYDENENPMSIRVPLPHELNIINSEDYIPPSFLTYTGDYGFFNFNWGTVLNPINNTLRGQDWVVYTYQMATGTAAQSWNVLERGYMDLTTIP